MSSPLAYFITFSSHGTWLHGRDPGSVDRQHNQYGTPALSPDPQREQACREKMKHPPYDLDVRRREIILKTICEVANHRNWQLWAVHVRTNHVHIVVSADARPEKVMSDFKAWSSRRLREALNESAEIDRWTRHGSTRYLWSEEQVDAEIRYTLEGQGEPMACFDGRVNQVT